MAIVVIMYGIYRIAYNNVSGILENNAEIRYYSCIKNAETGKIFKIKNAERGKYDI